MKINTLLSMAKKRKGCHIYWDDKHDRQWMQIGGTLYPLDGLPYLDKETLLVMMDVPEDKRDEYWIECESLPDKLRVLTADDVTDVVAHRRDMSITPLYDELLPIYVGEEGTELVLILADSLKPIADVAQEYLLFARKVDGKTWILAKNGFFTIAVISRVVVNDERSLEVLQDIVKHIQADQDAVKAREAKKHGEQQQI